MQASIEHFVATKRIAVAGVSRNKQGFGYLAMKELRERGYDAVPVNPNAGEVDGQPCYADVAAIPGGVEGLLVCVPAEQGKEVLRQAKSAGVDKVWLQQGSESPELLQLADDLGLETTAKKCILMYAEPVRSFHRFHRGLVKLFGKY